MNDRILPITRAVSAVIVPFLLLAFLILRRACSGFFDPIPGGPAKAAGKSCQERGGSTVEA
jgi:hypothetical protein